MVCSDNNYFLSYWLCCFSHIVEIIKIIFHFALVLACSSPYWKEVEPLFASISPDKRLHLSRQVTPKLVDELFLSVCLWIGSWIYFFVCLNQLKSADEYSGSLNNIFGPGNNIQWKMVYVLSFFSSTHYYILL